MVKERRAKDLPEPPARKRSVVLQTGSGEELVYYGCEIRPDGSMRFEASDEADHERLIEAIREAKKPPAWLTQAPTSGDCHLAAVAPVFPGKDFSITKNDQRKCQSMFGDGLAERFEALNICRTLATAGKHGKSESRPRPELRAHEVRPIPWMAEGPNGPICWDVRVLVGTQPWDARDLFLQAVADWRQFFALIGEDVPHVQINT